MGVRAGALHQKIKGPSKGNLREGMGESVGWEKQKGRAARTGSRVDI